MFSSVLFRFSKPNSCLVLIFFFSYLYHLPCAISQLEHKVCDTLFQCGNLTAGFPLWGVARPEPCGHPSLVLDCGPSNKTHLIISGQKYRVLQINNSSNTLRLARQDFLGEFCNTTFTGTTLTPELFELLPEYKTLFVYYLCDNQFHNPANFSCSNIGKAWVHRDNDYHEHCKASFNITVPTSYDPDEGALNVTHLASVLRKGFEVKLTIDERPCQKCKSSGGICAYNVSTPVCCNITNSSSEPKCTPMIPSRPIVVDEHHKHCSPFQCGNQELFYPFWTPDRKECGHPDFQVNCNGDLPELIISSVKFQILDLNYYDDFIRLARMDYRNSLCPGDPENVTINHAILPFSPDTVLSTFYYNCSGPRIELLPIGYIRQLDCGKDFGKQSYFVSSPSHPGNRAILSGLRTLCERIVNIPVSSSALRLEDENQSLEHIEQALHEGFKLRLNSNCSQCVRSEGACGYNETTRAFVCYCMDGPHEQTCPSVVKKKAKVSKEAKIGIGFACGFLGSVATSLLMFMLLKIGIQKRKTPNHPRDHNLKALVQMKQYSYAEVKKITKSFSHTVGKGGFGTVYGGNLSNGRKVAVKILKDFKSNGEDFINEVASMSQTSHVNIVSLLGFCYEGSKRAIVYEFLENGSLDQLISKKKSLEVDVSTLYRIAVGVARGLEYLHHGCKTRIVHFDIKPQNVLLDDNLCPKVSDFGLAKLCEKRESILSLLDARGTIGYIAPEVFSGMYGRVSHKSDVYSYGMLVLEMMGARNKETVETAASNSSSAYFPEWIYKDLENGEHTWKFGDEITREEKEIAKKMTLVGLWCIQPCPSSRPPMNKVVEMMEGSLDALEVPPKPSLNISTVPFPESSSLSEEYSNNTEVLI